MDIRNGNKLVSALKKKKNEAADVDTEIFMGEKKGKKKSEKERKLFKWKIRLTVLFLWLVSLVKRFFYFL